MAETQASMLQILAEIDFARRYYAFYEARKELEGSEGIDPAAVTELLKPYGFKYHKRDRFYRHFVRQADREIELHVAFADSIVELILGMEAGEVTFGGPFPWLAEGVAKLTDPAFSNDPPYPEIPYSDRNDLKEAIEFALGIFEEVKARFFSAVPSSKP